MFDDTPSALIADSHAIVIGASMAGLLAARVLADHYHQVTIVERDVLPSTATARAGVPQGRHAHVLLVRGQQILDDLFPGLTAELLQHGAPVVDWTADGLQVRLGMRVGRFPSGITSAAVSRILLETVVRQRVLALPNVQVLEHTEVTGLLSDTAAQRITGVQVRTRGADADARDIAATWVVDASGTHSHTPDWLHTLGYPVPHIEVVDPLLGYATRWYQPAARPFDWKALLVQSTRAAGGRMGAISLVEGNRWIVGLVGTNGDYPPTDEAGYLAFARSLPDPILADAIADAVPLSPIVGYRGTANRWRRFDRMPRWPDGLVVLGDAVCAFNPIYGQGMTTAALSALALRDGLQHAVAVTGRAQRIQRSIGHVVHAPWLLATGEDRRSQPAHAARANIATRALHWYMDRALLRAATSPLVQRHFMEVLHMTAAPTVFFHPRTAWHILRPMPNRNT